MGAAILNIQTLEEKDGNISQLLEIGSFKREQLV